jgi:hypothetical protein
MKHLQYMSKTAKTLATYGPVRLNLSVWLVNHDIVFFYHNKTASAGLSAA